MPDGHVVYLELFRLLFGEAGAVAAYCLVARTAALCCNLAIGVPTNHYVDDFITISLLTSTWWLTCSIL